VDLDFDAAGTNKQVSLSDSRNRTRCIIDLRNEFMCDDLADEAYFFDDCTYHNVADAALPPDTTPLNFCLDNGICEYLSTLLTGRVQYYTERAKVLDGAVPLDFREAIAILKHRRELIRNVFSRIGILICDYATALSEDVVKSMNGAVLTLASAHLVKISKAHALLLKHNEHLLAYNLGDSDDAHHGAAAYAAHDRSEARRIFERPLYLLEKILHKSVARQRSNVHPQC
jgi:hypothetical protein